MKLNNDSKFGVFYVTMISFTLAISLYATSLVGTLGDDYLSCSLSLKYYFAYCHYPPTRGHYNMLVIYNGPNTDLVRNGSLIPADIIGFDVNVTNSFFMPVKVHYNGFTLVILIYNSSVANPKDVVANKPFLIWGGWYDLNDNAWSFGIFNDNYAFYAAHMNITNFTKRIKSGTTKHIDLFAIWPSPLWFGQTGVTGNPPVLPGSYYIYAIAYGKASQPVELKIIKKPYEGEIVHVP